MSDSLLDKLKRTPTPLPAKGSIVDDVVPAERALWTETLAISLNKRFRRTVLLVPEPDPLVANGEGPGTSRFPSGLSSVPIKLEGLGRSELRLDLAGGFLALDQDSASLALSPWLGWCVTERAPATPVLI